MIVTKRHLLWMRTFMTGRIGRGWVMSFDKIKIGLIVIVGFIIVIAIIIFSRNLVEEFNRLGGVRGHIIMVGKEVKNIMKEIEDD